MADVQKYGDLTPRSAGKVWKQLEKRSIPMMVSEKFAQSRPLGKNETEIIIFRRYNSLAAATTPLAEGVTPAGSKPTYTDFSVRIDQYGDFIPFSDKVKDLHEDNIVSEYGDILAEQMALTKETLNFAVLKAGTTVYYAGSVAGRTTVVDFTTVGQLKKIIRYLRGQNCKPITKILKATPDYATQPVPASYVAFCDTDLVADLEALPGWKSVETYANSDARLHEYEVGSVANIRFIATPVLDAWPDAGGAAATKIATTSAAAACDVYPIIIMGQDAWATIPLRGDNTGFPIMVSTKPDKSDPLGQRGSVGWKMYHAGVILNDSYMARLECAATADPVA